jgi:hypothetical protein
MKATSQKHADVMKSLDHHLASSLIGWFAILPQQCNGHIVNNQEGIRRRLMVPPDIRIIRLMVRHAFRHLKNGLAGLR